MYALWEIEACNVLKIVECGEKVIVLLYRYGQLIYIDLCGFKAVILETILLWAHIELASCRQSAYYAGRRRLHNAEKSFLLYVPMGMLSAAATKTAWATKAARTAKTARIAKAAKVLKYSYTKALPVITGSAFRHLKKRFYLTSTPLFKVNLRLACYLKYIKRRQPLLKITFSFSFPLLFINSPASIFIGVGEFLYQDKSLSRHNSRFKSVFISLYLQLFQIVLIL